MILKLKLFLLIALVLSVNNAAAQDTWTWTQRYNGPKHLNDVAAGADGLFVAVGNDGAILTSSDGVDWIERNANTHHGLHKVIWGDGMFVAGGDSGTIITSGDGVEWVVRRSVGNRSIRSIAWGNGIYIATDDQQFNHELSVYISDNGIEWTEQQGTANVNGVWHFGEIVYGDGLFMSGASDCLAPVSTDGISWERTGDLSFWRLCCRPMEPCMPGCAPISPIAYGNGIFLLLSRTYRGMARYERDKNWEILHYDCEWLERTGVNSHSIIYDGVRFVMAGFNGIYFTENGDEFEHISAKSLDYGTSIVYNGDVYVTANGTEIGTLSEGFTSVFNQKQTIKYLSGFTVRQNGKMLKITLPNQNTQPKIALFNIAGKRKKVKPVFHADGTVSLSVSHLAPGLYVLSVNDKSKNWQKQVLIR